MDTLLISLHSRHAQNIFDRKKSIELRKQSPRISQDRISPLCPNSFSPEFDTVLIYEVAPVASIIGYCTPIEVFTHYPDKWVRDYQSSLCLTAREIWDYLGGDRMGYGIKLRNPQRIAPIPLSRMRELGIVPPQGYRYLSENQIEKLRISF